MLELFTSLIFRCLTLGRGTTFRTESKGIFRCFPFLLAFLLAFATAKAQTAGQLDTSFNPTDTGSDRGTNGHAYTVILQPDGKVILGGFFTTYNSTPRNHIARLNTDGSLDTSFNPGTGANNPVRTAVLQPDDKIIIAGNFTTYNGTARNRIARLNTDGSLDASFNPGTGANDLVYAAVLQPDGKVVIVGNFTTYNGTARSRIARLNTDGSLDTSFNPGLGTNNLVITAVLQPDGKVIIGGEFTSFNGTARNYIVRLNTNGSLDATFNIGTGTNYVVRTTLLQPDGKVIIGGSFTTYNGTSRNKIARLNTDGSLDATFNPGTGADGSVYTTILQPDSKILIGGNFTYYNGTYRSRMARLNANGSLDASLNPGGKIDSEVYTSVLQPDGKIIIGGSFTFYYGPGRNSIARLNVDGSIHEAFNPLQGADNWVRAAVLQPDGKLIIGGNFSTYNGTARNTIARINTDGSLDASFNPGTGTRIPPSSSGRVQTAILQPDGKVIIGGEFTVFNGTSRNNIARLNTDGSLDATFNPGTGTSAHFSGTSTVYTAVFQPDSTGLNGKVIIGGSFTAYNGTSRNKIARLNTDGSLDATFNPGIGPNGPIYTAIVQPDGKVIIGGDFTSVSGTPRNYIARLNADGSLDGSFNPGTGANLWVFTAVLQPDGKVIIVGAFTTYNGTVRSRIARLNTDGSLDTTFNPGTGANYFLFTAALQPDGKIIIGGTIHTYNGTSRNNIARINTDGSLDATFNPGTGPNTLLYHNVEVRTIVLQPDGKAIVGGGFTKYGDTGRNRVARIFGGVTNSISTGIISPAAYCQGATVSVSFTVSGTFNSGNVFTAQLSNASGFFDSPIAIGTLSGTSSGTISATIPAGTAAGSSYRIRVIASDPATTGFDNGNNIRIKSRVADPVAAASPATITQGQSTTLSVTNVSPNATYFWNGPGVSNQQGSSITITPTTSGANTYTVSATAAVSYCSPTGSGSVTVTATAPAFAISTGTISPLNFCPGSSVIVPYTATGAFNASNTFTAQVSNASGSFASPVTIGSASGNASGTITATIPVGTATGSGYRIRVIASNPATTGTDNGSDLMVQPTVNYYLDADADGFFSSSPTNLCYAPAGAYQLTPGTDCNDSDNVIYPGAPEICDGKDNDCNGIQDDVIAVNAVYITPTGSSPPTGNITQSICQGQSLTMNATIQDPQAVSGQYSYSYQWYRNGSILTGETGTTYTAATVGTYKIQVRKYCTSYPLSGVTSFSNEITITINALPTVTATSGGGVCTGNTANLFASAVSGATYSWSGPNNFTSSLQNPTVSNFSAGDAGNYIVIATVNGCSGSATTSISLNQPVSNNVLSSDQTICSGQPAATLTGTTPNGGDGITYNYAWQSSSISATTGFTNIPMATSVTFAPGTVSQTTWYRRIVVSGGGCEHVSAAVKVELLPATANPIASASPATLTLGQSTTLSVANVSPNLTYFWNGPGVANLSGSSIMVTPATLGANTYTVSAQANSGFCPPQQTGAVTITVNTAPTGIAKAEIGVVLLVYPNPSQGQFRLELSGIKAPVVEVTISDLAGKTVMKKQLNAKSNKVNEAIKMRAAKGIYLLQLTADGQIFNRKIVVE